jgi:hypothetical protein
VKTDEDKPMHAESSVNDTAKFELPQDLVAEMSRRNTARTDAYYQLDHKPSLFGRIARIFSGKVK